MKKLKMFEDFSSWSTTRPSQGKYKTGDILVANRNYLGFVVEGEEYRIVYKENEFYVLDIDTADDDKIIEWENSEEYEFSEEELDDVFTKK